MSDPYDLPPVDPGDWVPDLDPAELPSVDEALSVTPREPGETVCAVGKGVLGAVSKVSAAVLMAIWPAR